MREVNSSGVGRGCKDGPMVSIGRTFGGILVVVLVEDERGEG